MEALKVNMCTDCHKRPTCKKLCSVALAYVNQDGSIFELQDENSIMVFPRWNEVQSSRAKAGADSTDDFQNSYLEDNFSDDPENNPFSSFQPDHVQTQIFMLRFFDKWTYQDIAVKFDQTEDYVKNAYFQGIKRMVTGLEILDRQRMTKQNAITSLKNAESVKMLNPSQKDFLLHALFELPIKDIAEITGRKPNTVRSGIYLVTKHLRSGNYDFEDLATPGQWNKKTKANMKQNLKGQAVTA